jgi:hypothetical protein
MKLIRHQVSTLRDEVRECAGMWEGGWDGLTNVWMRRYEEEEHRKEMRSLNLKCNTRLARKLQHKKQFLGIENEGGRKRRRRTATTMTKACILNLGSVCTVHHHVASWAQNFYASLRRIARVFTRLRSPPSADAKFQELRTPAAAMQHVDVSEDERDRLSQPTDWPKDELKIKGFETYAQVREVLMKNPDFTDETITKLMEEVEKGTTTTHEQKLTLIAKAWAVRYTLEAMAGTILNVVPTTTTPYPPSNVSDAELNEIVNTKPEEGEHAQELHRKARHEQARRLKTTLDAQSIPQLTALLYDNAENSQMWWKPSSRHLRRNRSQAQAQAQLTAPCQAHLTR